MAKTQAERQADYRARRLAEKSALGHDSVQLTVIVSSAHRALLTAAAQRHNVTQSEMLARLIEESPIVIEMQRESDGFLAGEFSSVG